MAQPELYVRRRCCSRDFFVLAVVNAGLVAVAALMLHFRTQLMHSKWIDVVRGAFDRYADTFATGMLVVGGVLLGLVVFGSIVTLLRLKKLLVVYGMALTLTLVAMVFLVVSAFQVSNEAAHWHKKPYSPAAMEASGGLNANGSSKEAQVEVHFNTIYCDAQRAYFCDHATLNELLVFGLDKLVSVGNSTEDNGSATSAICKQAQVSSTANESSPLSSEWSRLCVYCERSKGYNEFESVVSWTQSNCGFSASTASFCSSSSENTNAAAVGAVPATAISSPYSACRAAILHEAVQWSQGFGIAWSVTCFLLLLLLICVALLLRTHDHAVALDLDDVESDVPDETVAYERA